MKLLSLEALLPHHNDLHCVLFQEAQPSRKSQLGGAPPGVCLLPQKTWAGLDILSQAALGCCQPSAPRRPPTSVPDGFRAGPSDLHQAQGGRGWRLSVRLQPPPRPAGRKRLPCVRLHRAAGAAAKVRVQGEVSSKESEISRSQPGPQRKLKTTVSEHSRVTVGICP